MSGKKQIFQLAPIDLSTVKATLIDVKLCSFVVERFTGLDNSVFLQETEFDNDPNAIEMTEFKGQSWPTPWDRAYIRNKTAQPGSTLVMTVGGPGTSLSPGTKASSIVSVLNRASIHAWKYDVTTGEVAIHTGLTIPAGYALVVKADKLNDDANPVRVRQTGEATFYTLYAGESIELRVNNANVVIADSDVATNDLHCIVEQ